MTGDKKLKEILLESEIDLNNLVFIPSGGSGCEDSGFEVGPRDFLKLSKENLRQNNLVDTISNAKRAIDCQIDEVLIVLGINTNNNLVLENFIGNFSFENNTSFKLKVIQSLNIAPIFLVSEIRKLRHNLEHEYKLPTRNDVCRAIDVAELMIRSIEPLVQLLPCEFYITDKKDYGNDDGFSLGFVVGLSVSFDHDVKEFEVCLHKTNKDVKFFSFKPDSIEYYVLIRLMNCIEDDYEATQSLNLALKD